MRDLSPLEENLYSQKLRVKKPIERHQSSKSSSNNQKPKAKKKKSATKSTKSYDKSKNLSLESISSAAMGFNCYKKMFIEHFESNGKERINYLDTKNSKSFETHYMNCIAANGKFGQNQKTFSEFLQSKKESDQIRLLDQTSRIFNAIAEYLIQNPLEFEQFDVKKIINKIKSIRIKIDDCKRILGKWDLIPDAKNVLAKEKTLEQSTVNNLNEFSVRLQLYERLKAAADEDAAMNTDKILKEMKRNGSKNSEEEADVKLNVKTPNMDKEKTTGEHFLIETQRSNLEFLCSEIEELYTGEEHLFSALMAHLYESTNINNLFQFKNGSEEQNPLVNFLTDATEKSSQKKNDLNPKDWKDYKNVIDSNEKTSIMEREQQFKQMYSSEDVSKEINQGFLKQKVALPAVNMIAKSTKAVKEPLDLLKKTENENKIDKNSQNSENGEPSATNKKLGEVAELKQVPKRKNCVFKVIHPNTTKRENIKLLATSNDFSGSTDSVGTIKKPVKQSFTKQLSRIQKFLLLKSVSNTTPCTQNSPFGESEDLGFARSFGSEINGPQPEGVAQILNAKLDQLNDLSQCSFQENLPQKQLPMIYQSPISEPQIEPNEQKILNENGHACYLPVQELQGSNHTSFRPSFPLQQNQTVPSFFDPKFIHIPPNNCFKQQTHPTFQAHRNPQNYCHPQPFTNKRLNEPENQSSNFRLPYQQESNNRFIPQTGGLQGQQFFAPIYPLQPKANNFIGFTPCKQESQQYPTIYCPIPSHLIYALTSQTGHIQNGQVLVPSYSDPNRGQIGVSQNSSEPFSVIPKKSNA